MTKCQFNRLKGDTVQTLFTIRALAGHGIRVDVVFAPDKDRPPVYNVPILNVDYHAVKVPTEVAICLWMMDRDACVLARGIGFTLDLAGKIPKDSLYAYLYGNHWKAPCEILERIERSCGAVFTQGDING